MSTLSSKQAFMALMAGDSILTANGEFKVFDTPTRSGDIPKILLVNPDETKQFYHWDENKNIVFDDNGTIVECLIGSPIRRAKPFPDPGI